MIAKAQLALRCDHCQIDHRSLARIAANFTFLEMIENDGATDEAHAASA
jgi:hypothetical protein